MKQIILIVTAFMLTSCGALNHGFPRGISGKLKSINSQEIILHVEQQNTQ